MIAALQASHHALSSLADGPHGGLRERHAHTPGHISRAEVTVAALQRLAAIKTWPTLPAVAAAPLAAAARVPVVAPALDSVRVSTPVVATAVVVATVAATATATTVGASPEAQESPPELALQGSSLGAFDEVVAMLRGSEVSLDGAAAAAAAAATSVPNDATAAPGLAQLLPSPPLLSVADVPWLQATLPAGWSEVMSDSRARLLRRRPAAAGGRAIWATTAEVPAPPVYVAAAMRAVLREWGTSDHLVSQLRVLSEGGGAPEWMTECSGVFEQLLHAVVVAPPTGRDCVLRSVWALADGAHACSIRAAPPRTAAQVPPPMAGMPRAAVAADVWVLENPVEPGGSLLHAVVDAGDLADLELGDLADLEPSSVGAGAGAGTGAPLGPGAAARQRQVLGWTRRVAEAAILLKRRGDN